MIYPDILSVYPCRPCQCPTAGIFGTNTMCTRQIKTAQLRPSLLLYNVPPAMSLNKTIWVPLGPRVQTLTDRRTQLTIPRPMRMQSGTEIKKCHTFSSTELTWLCACIITIHHEEDYQSYKKHSIRAIAGILSSRKGVVVEINQCLDTDGKNGCRGLWVEIV